MTSTSGWPEILPRPSNLDLKETPSPVPWFQVREVDERTYALLEPNHNEEVISYLILGNERAVLLDTGMGIADIRAVVESLTELPVVVVNSHWHYDHIGGNHLFEEVWAFDNDWEIGRLEAGLGPAECRAFMAPPESCFDLPEGFELKTYEIRPSRVTRRLNHLERLDLGGRELTVIHAPGHCPGEICLLDPDTRTLFTGDAYYPGLIFADLEESDFGAFRRTIQALAALVPDLDYLCPAHNEARIRPDHLLKAARAFDRVAEGGLAFEPDGEHRIYRFGDFSLSLPGE